VTCSSIAAAVGDTSPMTVSADAALLLAQQHQQQQNEAASAAGISLDDSYMKDDGEGASFMKEDDAAEATEASAYLKDSSEGLVKDEEPSAGLSITDSASGLIFSLLLYVFALIMSFLLLMVSIIIIIISNLLCAGYNIKIRTSVHYNCQFDKIVQLTKNEKQC